MKQDLKAVIGNQQKYLASTIKVFIFSPFN